VCSLSLVPISTICFECMSCSEYQFAYDELTGAFETERRLRADLRIDCDDPVHQYWEWYATAMLALYPIGVPLIGASLLWKNRTAIRAVLADLEQKEEAGMVKTKTEVPGHIDQFKSLFVYYRPSCYWWGLADILQRLLLTGFASLFNPGSLMQIAMAVIISFAFFCAQITLRPYLNSYHNSMSALVNMQIVVTFFASLLIKVANEAGQFFRNETGYDLEDLGVFLICWNLIAILEIVRYAKTTVEFAASVIIVRNAGGGNSPVAKKYFGTKRDTKESKRLPQHILDTFDLGSEACIGQREEYMKDLDSFVDTLDEEKFADKVSWQKKHELRREIEDVQNWVSDADQGTATEDVAMKQKKLEKLEDSLKSKVSVEGFFYPLGPDLRLFPEKSIFQQFIELLSGKGRLESENDKRPCWKRVLFWQKTAYANDVSGWVLRETAEGWELAANVLESPDFIVGVERGLLTGCPPPKSGWTIVASGLAAELIVTAPLSWKRASSAKILSAHELIEARSNARSSGVNEWTCKNEFMEILHSRGGTPKGGSGTIELRAIRPNRSASPKQSDLKKMRASMPPIGAHSADVEVGGSDFDNEVDWGNAAAEPRAEEGGEGGLGPDPSLQPQFIL